VVRRVWKHRQSTDIFWRTSLRLTNSLVSSFQGGLSRNDPLFLDEPASRSRPQSLPVHSTNITVQLLEAWGCHSPIQSHFRGNGHAWFQWSVQCFLSVPLHLIQTYPLYIGEVHQRQRRVMLPAFTKGQLRSFLGVFRHAGESVSLRSAQWCHRRYRSYRCFLSLGSIGEATSLLEAPC